MYFPMLLSAAMALILALMAVSRIVAGSSDRRPVAPVPRRGLVNFAAVTAAVVLYLLLAEHLGFVITSSVLLFGLLLRLGSRLWTSAVVTVVLVPLFNPDGNDLLDPKNRAMDLEALHGQRGPEQVGTRYTGEGLNLNRDYTKQEAVESRHLSEPHQLEDALDEGRWDLVLCATNVDGVDIAQVVKIAASEGRGLPVIVIHDRAGEGARDAVVEALESGAGPRSTLIRLLDEWGHDAPR